MSITLNPGDTTIHIEQDKDTRRTYRVGLKPMMPPGDALTSFAWSNITPGLVIEDTVNDETDVAAAFSGGEPNRWYAAVGTWTSMPSGTRDQFVVRVFIQEDAELVTDMGSPLFPNKFTAVSQLRRDTLLVAAQNHGMPEELDNSYLWGKLRAAEAELETELRVKFQSTAVFSREPTQAEIDALAGMPYLVDTGYDYDPDMWQGDRWGFIQTRFVPVQSVTRYRFAYPTDGGQAYDMPIDWLQVDRKYGHIRVVPMGTTSVAALLAPWLMAILSAGRMIPNMVQLNYVTGLPNAARDFPQLVDAVKKLAVLKIIEESFTPQSGSISGDGLSQSMSIDVSKYHESVDRIINGSSGNGGLMAAIHGVRLAVM